MEECRSIPKIQDQGLPPETHLVINTECGAFDNEHKVLPRNRFDLEVDRTSLHPGEQTYEKMVAGLYLGHLVRLVLLELGNDGRLFKGMDTSRLKDPTSLDAKHLSVIEGDRSESLSVIRDLFCAKFDIDPEPYERRIIRYVVDLVGIRAARLYVCGIAAICKKKNMERCHVGVDGAAFDKNSSFQQHAMEAAQEIFGWPPDEDKYIHLSPAEQASGLGAALIAALALERNEISFN